MSWQIKKVWKREYKILSSSSWKKPMYFIKNHVKNRKRKKLETTWLLTSWWKCFTPLLIYKDIQFELSNLKTKIKLRYLIDCLTTHRKVFVRCFQNLSKNGFLPVFFIFIHSTEKKHGYFSQVKALRKS